MNMPTSESSADAAQPTGPLALPCRATGAISRWAGFLSCLAMLVLAASVILGIGLRQAHIDNSWTYDLDMFALIWLAFVGAAYTSLRGAHVTSGIALENMFGDGPIHLLLACLRFVIVAGFLLIFLKSSYDLASSSFSFHETTLDIVQWPVWVSKIALPIGILAWLIAEIHKFLRLLATRR